MLDQPGIRHWINQAALLCERREIADVRGSEVYVDVDPSRQTIARLVAMAPGNLVRGMVAGDRLYCWDAMDGGHRDVARALYLGIPYIPFIVGRDMSKLRSESDWQEESFHQAGDLAVLMDQRLIDDSSFLRRFPDIGPKVA